MPCPICGVECGFHATGSGIVVIEATTKEDRKMLVLDQRYYLNADRTRAMSESDMADEQKAHAQRTPEQLANLEEDEKPFEPTYLLGGVGALISEEDADRLGISDLDGHDVQNQKAVAQAIKGLPNLAAVESVQLLAPEQDRTALQRVQDVMFEQERRKRGDDSPKVAVNPVALRRASRRERAQTGDATPEGSDEAK